MYGYIKEVQGVFQVGIIFCFLGLCFVCIYMFCKYRYQYWLYFVFKVFKMGEEG